MLERWQPQSRQRLALLLPLSLALHLPLLAYFSAPVILPVADSASNLSVRMVSTSRNNRNEAEPTIENASSQDQSPESEPRQVKHKSEPASDQPDSDLPGKMKQARSDTADTPGENQKRQKTNRTDPPPDPAQTEPITNRARVQQRLQQEIPNHFYYPRLARLHGYQGTVMLEIELHRQGYIGEIQILKSSGFRILDLAAREAASRMAVGWASQLLHEPSMKIKLPVQYILTEG